MEINMGDLLPADVIIEILSWLPVKPLLRFKFVSKSWYDVITSPDFISKHLENYYKNSSSSNNNNGFLYQYYVLETKKVVVYAYLLDETSGVSSYAEVLRERPIYKNSLIYGPCDGIFYLEERHDDYKDLIRANDRIRALWNPATKEVKTLPPLIRNPNLSPHTHYYGEDYIGFGFDIVTKDYKVIVINCCVAITDYPSSVFVYSLSTDSWRYCGDLPYYLFNNNCYICLNGVFYWLGTKSPDPEAGPEFTVSFDLATELSQEITDYDKQVHKNKSLTVYQDTLAMLSVDYIGFLDIWTLNERCWTRKFRMDPILGKWGYLIGHWKNDKFIFENNSLFKQLILCDPLTQEITDLGYGNGYNNLSQGIFVYQESLVSLKDKQSEERREAKALAS